MISIRDAYSYENVSLLQNESQGFDDEKKVKTRPWIVLSKYVNIIVD